jgi:hypothetical protein
MLRGESFAGNHRADATFVTFCVCSFCSLGASMAGLPYAPPIPKAHLETYRAAARAYRAARRKNARQHEWHWAAVREVIKRHTEMTHREADSDKLAGQAELPQ